MTFRSLFAAAVAVALAIGVGVAQPPPQFGLPKPPTPLPNPPANVSSDPRGEQPPQFGIPPGEKVELLLVAERLAGLAGEDAVDWSVKSLNAEAAWKQGVTGKGVKVAVLDTGIAAGHRDLKDGVKGSKDFTGSRVGSDDKNGHGTHCAGSIGARKNGWGLVGVAYDCDLYAGKVLGDGGSGSVDGIRDGILWAVTEVDADVISMSLGGGGAESYIPVGLKAAEEKGVIVLCAAGNDGNGRPVNYPAAYPFPLAVSAIDSGLKLASFSCTGSKVEVCGPGVNVRSTYPGAGDGLFADLSGTSMATPNVAGAAALWVQADKAKGGERKTRPQRFRDWLKATAKDLGSDGRDASYGYGLPDCGTLKLDGEQPPPPPGPQPPAKIVIDPSKLTDAAKDELRKGGIGDFKLEITPLPPKPVDAPRLPADRIAERLRRSGGKQVVFVGVDADLAKYPDGVILTDPPAGLKPGVYEVELEEVLSFNPSK